LTAVTLGSLKLHTVAAWARPVELNRRANEKGKVSFIDRG
jgi:hypothetical protein